MTCLRRFVFGLAVSGGLLCGVTLPGQSAATYEPKVRVRGTIRIWGSPQMQDLLVLYEKGFLELQPDVQFANELKSTLVAVPGVYTGRAEIGLLGREIWPMETEAFEAVLRRKQEVVDVATGSYDVPKATYALMIFVQSSNPMRSVSMAQLERVFGAGDARVRTWGELGLTGAWARRPIHLYGFSIDNEKAQIFRRIVFHADEQWNEALHQFRNGAGPAADAGAQIVQAIAHDPDGIGISCIMRRRP